MIDWIIFGLLATVALSLIACVVLFVALLRRVRALEQKPAIANEPPQPAAPSFAATFHDVQRAEARKLYDSGADPREIARATGLEAPESHLLIKVFEATGSAGAARSQIPERTAAELL